MKIVVAMDSFKGSMTAARVCAIVAETVRSTMPDAEVVSKPMADGGEGTAAALMEATGGRWVPRRVMGPLPAMQVDAGFVWLPENRTAVVEMALASGLTLLDCNQQNPLKTTTYGTGQLIEAAGAYGAERVLLAIGGSATVDGGVGAAQALGWSFWAANGREVPWGGGHLAQIERIIPPEREIGTAVDVLCDVDNPLCGEHGAARVYGPQKGATPEMVEVLEDGLAHLADLVNEQLARNVRDLPGAGAAGGLAAGAVAFMNAHLVCGIDEVMSQCHLQEDVADADWVITGEGRLDAQSLRGKVVSGVVRAARRGGAKVAVIAGEVCLSPVACRAAGIETAIACKTNSISLDEAMANAEKLVARTSHHFARTHLAGR